MTVARPLAAGVMSAGQLIGTPLQGPGFSLVCTLVNWVRGLLSDFFQDCPRKKVSFPQTFP